MTITTPHLAIPFTLGADGTFNTVEQDSPDHIAQRVQAATLTTVGHRDDDPTFGIPDQVFTAPGVDLDEIRAALADSEPAASVALEHVTSTDDLRVDRLSILILEN